MIRNKTMKKYILMSTLCIVITLVFAGNSNAALQSNHNTQYTKTDFCPNWITNVRTMEKAGQAMGLNETQNEDLTSTESNNIDVHMIKSTEYGAAAILSASGYGNPKKIDAYNPNYPSDVNSSTTGNETGVFNMAAINNCIWVAGTLEGILDEASFNKIYYDIYTEEQTSARVGDALGSSSTLNPGCTGWHSSSGVWIQRSYSRLYFARGNYSIFHYTTPIWNSATYPTHSVVVCGQGL